MMTGVIMDDTEGAGLMRAQQAANAHLLSALHLAKVSVWRVDLATNRIRFNDVGYEVAGITPHPEGVSLDEIRALAHPDDAPNLVRAAEQATTGTDVIDLEVRYRRANGSYRSMLTRRVAERDEQGRVIGLLGITLDQSEQKAEHERVRTLMRRMEVVADAADLGIWSVDGETGQVEWNAQMYRITPAGRRVRRDCLRDGVPHFSARWFGALGHLALAP